MKISKNATMSAAAVLGLPQLDAYSNELLASCVAKQGGKHERPASTEGLLWSITAIARNEKYGGTRTVAVCTSFERAMKVVEANEGDIWEYSYMLAVVESFRADALYGGTSHEPYWFLWKGGVDGRYEAIETPVLYEGTVGFAVG